MLSPISYQRSKVKKKGSWQLLTSNRGDRGASFTCPDCVKTYYLDHTIWSDGLVTPSVVCPTRGCNFHENIKLEGWDASHS